MDRKRPTNLEYPIDRKEYFAIHQFIYRNFGTATTCVFCEREGLNHYEWANVSGEYTRDIQDYLPLCVSCHRSFDYSEKQRASNRERLRTTRPAMGSRIGQYKNGKLLKIHQCLADAARSVNRSHASLLEHINRGYGQSAGYQWSKLDD